MDNKLRKIRNTVSISFDEFERHMKAIESILKLEEDLDSAVCNLNSSGLYADITFPNLVTNVITLLTLLTNDTENWIDYFVFELDFGRRYGKDELPVEINGTPTRLHTISDLWNILIFSGFSKN